MFTPTGVPIEFPCVMFSSIEFPITFLGISFQSIFFFTRVSKIETTKGYTNRNTITTKVHGSNDQKIAEEKSKILRIRFRSNWTKNLRSDQRRIIFLSSKIFKRV
jgi:hypothetical protein